MLGWLRPLRLYYAKSSSGWLFSNRYNSFNSTGRLETCRFDFFSFGMCFPPCDLSISLGLRPVRVLWTLYETTLNKVYRLNRYNLQILGLKTWYGTKIWHNRWGMKRVQKHSILAYKFLGPNRNSDQIKSLYGHLYH